MFKINSDNAFKIQGKLNKATKQNLYQWFHKIITSHELNYEHFSFEPVSKLWLLVFLNNKDKSSFQFVFDNHKKDRLFRFKGCPLRFKELELDTSYEITVDFEKYKKLKIDQKANNENEIKLNLNNQENSEELIKRSNYQLYQQNMDIKEIQEKIILNISKQNCIKQEDEINIKQEFLFEKYKSIFKDLIKSISKKQIFKKVMIGNYIEKDLSNLKLDKVSKIYEFYIKDNTGDNEIKYDYQTNILNIYTTDNIENQRNKQTFSFGLNHNGKVDLGQTLSNFKQKSYMVADPITIQYEILENEKNINNKENVTELLASKPKIDNKNINFPSTDGKEIHEIRQLIIKLIVDNDISIFNKLTQNGLIKSIILKRGQRFLSNLDFDLIYKNKQSQMVSFLVYPDHTNFTQEIVKLNKLLVELNNLNDEVFSEQLNHSKLYYSDDHIDIKFSIQLHSGTSDGQDANSLVVQSEQIITDQPINVYSDKQMTLQSRIGPYVYQIKQTSFFQINEVGCKILQDQLLKNILLFKQGRTKKVCLLDLCCGVGSIGIQCSQHVDRVVGIEIEQTAIDMAIDNAKLNKVENVDYICGKVEDKLCQINTELEFDANEQEYIAILDPSRSGLAPKLMKSLRNMKVIKEILQVFCNPNIIEDQIRDLITPNQTQGEGSKRQLSNHFNLDEIAGIDLFPRTEHLEVVCKLSRYEM